MSKLIDDSTENKMEGNNCEILNGSIINANFDWGVVMDAYPISLEQIARKVDLMNGRKRTKLVQMQLDGKYANIKEEINEFGEPIIRVDGDIPPDLKIEDGEHFLFISYDQSTYTHGLHRYPAKFFPELPRWLIHKYSQRARLS